MRDTLRRYHLWLGWIVGLPLLIWTLSGLVMVSRPLAETRSEDALRPAGAIATTPLVAPALTRTDVSAVALAASPTGPRWRIAFADGGAAAADARTGQMLDRISPVDASAAAVARYTGTAKVSAVKFIDRNHRPREFGRKVDAWQVTMDDGLHLYVDAWSGEVLVARSRWWRIYDFFWGLHIMDLQGRDNPNNPWVVTFVILGLISVVLALVILPDSTRRMLRSTPEPE